MKKTEVYGVLRQEKKKKDKQILSSKVVYLKIPKGKELF